MGVEGKICLVSGADSDDGSAIAQALAGAGASVLACVGGSAQPPPERKIGRGSVTFTSGDLTRRSDAERVVAEVDRRFGRLDALVNELSSPRAVGTILDITEEEFDRVVKLDLLSMILVSSAAVPLMTRSGGGAIVNMSSIIGEAGGKGRALRSACKGAVRALTTVMALDHGEANIRVNAILLGPLVSPAITAQPQAMQTLIAESALKRLPTTDDLGALAVFLCSEESRNITGALIPLDAGRLLPKI